MNQSNKNQIVMDTPLLTNQHTVDAIYNEFQNEPPISNVQAQQQQTSYESTSYTNTSSKERILRKYAKTRNWDKFYTLTYKYYTRKGIYSTLLGRIFNLLTMLFVVFFTTFLIGCIDHANIATKRTLNEAILENCPVLSWFHVCSLIIFGVFWLYLVKATIQEYHHLFDMHEFYLHVLLLKDADLNTISWDQVLEKIQEAFAPLQTKVSHSTSLDVVNRIMRKENYLIALFNKNLLNLRAPVPPRTPLIGGHQLLTQVVQWNLNICVIDYVFGEVDQGGETSVKPIFLRDTDRHRHISELRKRFIYMGIFNLLMAPYSLVFLTVWFLFKYGEEFHKNPTALSARSYSPLAKWKFRDFNELPHLFEYRLFGSYESAMKYMGQFSNENNAIIAKFVSFVSGSLALSLTILSLLDDDILLNFEITKGRSTLWYLGLFSVIWSASRSFIPNPHVIHDPQAIMSQVIKHSHYCPSIWRKWGLHSPKVMRDFGKHFDYRISLFVYEMISVAIVPFILIFQLPDCSADLLDFFRQFTVSVDGVGNVCTYSVFEFRNFNQNRGLAPTGRNPSPIGSVHGVTDAGDDEGDKMKASIMNFKSHYKAWGPKDLLDSQYLSQSIADSHYDPSQQTYHGVDARGGERGKSDTSDYINKILEEERRISVNPSPQSPRLEPLSTSGNQRASSSGGQRPSVSQTAIAGYVPPQLPYDSDESDEGHELETDLPGPL